MNKKVNFTWELKGKDWKWEATNYEGHGIFFGKVTSPYVPSGEYGSWYHQEIINEGAVLTKGSFDELNKLLSTEGTKKAMKFQKEFMDIGNETKGWN